MKKKVLAVLLTVMSLTLSSCGLVGDDGSVFDSVMPQIADQEDKAEEKTDEKTDENEKEDVEDKAEKEKDSKAEQIEAILSGFEAEEKGVCGGDLIWEYGNGLLYIHGTGNMTDFERGLEGYTPWADLQSSIIKVVIDEGCTSIGDNAFYNLDSLSGVTISDSVTHIGDSAFEDCGQLESIAIPASVTSLGEGALNQCKSLKNITFDKDCLIEDYNFADCFRGNREEISLPDKMNLFIPYTYSFPCDDESDVAEFANDSGEYADYDRESLAEMVRELYPERERLICTEAFERVGTINWNGKVYHSSDAEAFLSDLEKNGILDFDDLCEQQIQSWDKFDMGVYIRISTWLIENSVENGH